MIEDSHIEKFTALFQGNERSFGQWNPRSKSKMLTIKNQYTTEHVRSHLEGEVGIGMVPILDSNKCWFAALDIDVHGPNAQDIDVVDVESRVTRANLPMVVCRSKSGGAHCYVFFNEATDANQVRMLLTRWSKTIGFPSAEIFPKQSNLDKKPADVERPLGNWINLPYYNAFETERFAVDGGKQVDFEYFLEIAEGKRISAKDYEDAGSQDDYERGPPCLQEMIKNRIEEGSRNVAIFQAGIFLKRAFADDWRDRLREFNRIALVTQLSDREIRTIMGSVARKDYQYKCREEPCKSLCNRDACKTREFGITDSDATANEVPLFDAVEKIIATPVRWALHVKGQVIEVTTPQLFNYDLLRQAVGEKLHIVLPRLKNQEWDQYLREIMTKVQVKQEMTIEDLIFERLCEFLRRASIDKNVPEDTRREALTRGMPVLMGIGAVKFMAGKAVPAPAEEMTWYYAFRLLDFIEYLKRKKALPVNEHALPTHLIRLLGDEAKRDKVRVGSRRVGNVWCVPEGWVENGAIPVKTTEVEY